ncbi:MAG: hypothetical protein ACREGC_04135, partial [Minisyncoccia bacterium]
SLGQGIRSKKIRLDELASIAMAGNSVVNRYAQELTTVASAEDGPLADCRLADPKTMQQAWHFARLKARAASEDARAAKQAQWEVDMAIFEVKIYQQCRFREKRAAELLNRAATGNAVTQDIMLKAVSSGRIGGTPATSDVDVALAYVLYNEIMLALSRYSQNSKAE